MCPLPVILFLNCWYEFMHPETVDVLSFRKNHSEACLRLETLCEAWEKKMNELELPDDSKEEGV